ncbi:MAG: ABC transporter substrate-binding protein [Rubrobacter sp.]|nr:ABC transporter substrate-binding protein [Rubrobacter sp.]
MRNRSVYTGRTPARWSRRQFLRMGGAGLAGAAMLGASACGPAEEPDNGAVNIVFAFGTTGPEDLRTTEEVVERFNREYEGEIQVEFRQMSSDTGEYFRSMVSDFQAGGGDVDVMAGDVIWAAEFAENGWIEDITRRLYTDYEPEPPGAFLQAPLQSCSYRNSVWGVPWFTDAGLLYYRRDLLEESGFDAAPTTWEGLREIAAQVQEESGTQFGLVFQGADYEGGVVNGLEFVWSAGGNVLTGNITALDAYGPRSLSPDVINIDSEQSARGLQIARSLIEDGISPQEVSSYQEEESSDAFFAGDAVFMRGWPYMYALATEEGSNVEPGQVGIAALPVAEEGLQSFSCLGGWNMYINSASDNQDAAWEFIKFATAPEQQRFRALEGSFLPTLQDLYGDGEILEQAPVIELGRDVIVDNARPRPVTAFYSQISTRLARGFNANLEGEAEPEEVTENLQGELESIVRQN